MQNNIYKVPFYIKLTLVYIIVLHNILAGDDFREIKDYKMIDTGEIILMNPYRLLVDDNDMFIFDPGSENMIIHMDTTGRYLSSFGPLGQGPGEINRVANFAGLTDKYLFISNWKKIHIFNRHSSEFIKSLIVNVPFGKPHKIFKDWIVVWGMDPEVIFIGYELSPEFNIQYDSILKLGYYDNRSLYPFRSNPLLKQGQVFSDSAGIYFSFTNSSLILGFNESGELIFNTDKPYSIRIPDVVKYGNDDFSAPLRDKYPEVTIAITGDDKYIYTLYSGTVFKTRLGALTNAADIGQGELLNIYLRESGRFICSYKLPFPFRDICATDTNIYGLSVDPEIAIYKLEKPLK